MPNLDGTGPMGNSNWVCRNGSGRGNFGRGGGCRRNGNGPGMGSGAGMRNRNNFNAVSNEAVTDNSAAEIIALKEKLAGLEAIVNQMKKTEEK